MLFQLFVYYIIGMNGKDQDSTGRGSAESPTKSWVQFEEEEGGIEGQKDGKPSQGPLNTPAVIDAQSVQVSCVILVCFSLQPRRQLKRERKKLGGVRLK